MYQHVYYTNVLVKNIILTTERAKDTYVDISLKNWLYSLICMPAHVTSSRDLFLTPSQTEQWLLHVGRVLPVSYKILSK